MRATIIIMWCINKKPSVFTSYEEEGKVFGDEKIVTMIAQSNNWHM